MAEKIPLGIQKLMGLSEVLIRQKTTLFAGNEYEVLEASGAPLLAAEEVVVGIRLLGSHKNRAFDIQVLDTNNQKVISLRRPFTFGADKMEVSMCERVVSVVRQEMTFIKPVLNINSPADKLVLRIKGPSVPFGVCDFVILSPCKQQVGVIKKLWRGSVSDMVTHRNDYSISFPLDLAVEYKATIIGACFLIDFLYFES